MKKAIKAASLAAVCLSTANADPDSDGTIILNSRLRYEFADQQDLDDSNAFTLRTRLGYQSGVHSGFSFLAECEYNWELNSGDFAAYPPPFNAGDTVIADGESFDINRFIVKYQSEPFTAIVGRQDINLLNQRHIGTVAWRQNDQTQDAARIRFTAIPDFVLDYTYNWQVNRVFGSQAPAGVLKRFHTDNHILNATYTGIDDLTLGAYAYLLRLRNAPALSSDTVGLFADGSVSITSEYAFKYRAEWSYQTDNSHTAGPNVGEHYIHLRGAVVRKNYEVGLGFESLGGNGTTAYQTPLATLHAFNGWADTFLTTPAAGLRDYYLFAGAPLGWGINARLEAHQFTAEDNGTTFGHEYGISLVKKLNDNLTALAKASQYEGRASVPGVVGRDKTKFWLQLDYTF
jgi:hypothetical protein